MPRYIRNGENQTESGDWHPRTPLDPWGHWEESEWVTGDNDPYITEARTFVVKGVYYTSSQRQDAIDDFLKRRNGEPYFKSGEARCQDCDEYGRDNFTPKMLASHDIQLEASGFTNPPHGYIKVWCKACMIDQFYEDTFGTPDRFILCRHNNMADDEEMIEEIDHIRKKAETAIIHITDEIRNIENDIEQRKHTLEISKTDCGCYNVIHETNENDYTLYNHKKAEHETEIECLNGQITQITYKIEELHKLSAELCVTIDGNTDTLKKTISDKLEQEKRSLKEIELIIGSKQLDKEESQETVLYKETTCVELQGQLNIKENELEIKRKLLQQKTHEAQTHTNMLLKIEFNKRIGKLNGLLKGVTTYTQGKKMCENMDAFINSMTSDEKSDFLMELMATMDVKEINETITKKEELSSEEKLEKWKLDNKYISQEENQAKLKMYANQDTNGMDKKKLQLQLTLIRECVNWEEIEIPADLLPKVPKKKGVAKLDKNGKPIDRGFNYTDPEKSKTNFFCKWSNGKDGTPKKEKGIHQGCGLIYKNKAGRDKHSAKCTWEKSGKNKIKNNKILI